jgi:hypothetical protein
MLQQRAVRDFGMSGDPVPVHVMRRTTVVGVLLCFIVTALLVSGTTAAYASSPPTARQLAAKLVKAKICTTIQSAKTQSVNATAVDCLTSGANDPIHVNAFTKKAAMLSDLKAFQNATCKALLSAMPGSKFTMSYVVGATWYIQTGSAHVSLRDVAKKLGGKVQPHTCS